MVEGIELRSSPSTHTSTVANVGAETARPPRLTIATYFALFIKVARSQNARNWPTIVQAAGMLIGFLIDLVFVKVPQRLHGEGRGGEGDAQRLNTARTSRNVQVDGIRANMIAGSCEGPAVIEPIPRHSLNRRPHCNFIRATQLQPFTETTFRVECTNSRDVYECQLGSRIGRRISGRLCMDGIIVPSTTFLAKGDESIRSSHDYGTHPRVARPSRQPPTRYHVPDRIALGSRQAPSQPNAAAH